MDSRGARSKKTWALANIESGIRLRLINGRLRSVRSLGIVASAPLWNSTRCSGDRRATRVHTTLGPGFLGGIYARVLLSELRSSTDDPCYRIPGSEHGLCHLELRNDRCVVRLREFHILPESAGFIRQRFVVSLGMMEELEHAS